MEKIIYQYSTKNTQIVRYIFGTMNLWIQESGFSLHPDQIFWGLCPMYVISLAIRTYLQHLRGKQELLQYPILFCGVTRKPWATVLLEISHSWYWDFCILYILYVNFGMYSQPNGITSKFQERKAKVAISSCDVNEL